VIEGLTYVPEFITQVEQERLLSHIDQQEWSTELKRRVQHYGYRYDYRRRTVTPEMKVGPLPDWVGWLIQRAQEQRLIHETPDQLIINEYQPGQGIAPHIDVPEAFGPVIWSVNLLSDCVMYFHPPDGGTKQPLRLAAGSFYKLTGPARYEWKHEIPARKTDTYRGKQWKRERRLSLTFRTV
jgi:alkylated DNA repair dioxygenase AlkB